MIRAAAIAITMSAVTMPAIATEWIDCADDGMNASISLLVGALDVLSVVAAKLDVGDSHWVTSPEYGEGSAEPLAVGQAFEDQSQLLVDLMDEAIATKLAELRLFKASEGGVVVYAGTLWVPGKGAWAVACSGP